MDTTEQNRLLNLRRLIVEFGGSGKLAKKLGYTNASYLAQIAGPNPIRPITEKTARRFEQSLGLQIGVLDAPQTEAPVGRRPAPAAERSSAPVAVAPEVRAVTDILRMVAVACDESHVNLPLTKFADLVALVYTDTVETNTTPSVDRVKRLVRLLTPS